MTERTHNPDARIDRELAGWWTGDVWKVVDILAEFRPDLKITCVDTSPTGNICVTNLSPGSTVLRDNYWKIIEKYKKIDANDECLAQFYERFASRPAPTSCGVSTRRCSSDREPKRSSRMLRIRGTVHV